MRQIIRLNDDWIFAQGFDPAWRAAPMTGAAVSLPHNAVDLPQSYFDETCYQRPFTYQRRLRRGDWDGCRVEMQFDGAMADAVVWVNGVQVVAHPDGYTPFTADLTPHLADDNLITVRIDGSENPAIPPFGGQIDYLTYAGIYRDVWLRVLPARHIRDVRVLTPDPLADARTVVFDADLSAPGPLLAVLRGPDGAEIARSDGAPMTGLRGIALWSPDNPALYSLDVSLPDSGDRITQRFGFRSAEWRPEGFFLNGQRVQLRGLNRHQAFPHAGYAAGRHAQERDAEIVRFDLGCNLVRSSHYPPSPWFLDRCDEIGLMVFNEIPGWQHIGGPEWQDAALANTGAMIRRDRNHPSIIVWGVRINESPDCHGLYARTNALARQLDPTRATTGVRCITDSELLEDVYAMNDFVLDESELPGVNRPRTALRPVPEVTGLSRAVPYIVTEFNGHMFPTKAGDPELRQMEHVIRHLEVMNAAYGDPAIAGSVGWCMFDYNTHKDFGAGDRICHHGVMDMWREPKFAAFAYASQKPPSQGVVMQPVTFWARGERNFGGILPLIVLTNCDEIEFDCLGIRRRVGPDRERFPHLPHPPVIIDHRHLSAEELGLWGMAWHPGTITGWLDGQPVIRREYVADPLPTRLEIAPDADRLPAAADTDLRVILRALDQVGNRLPFLAGSVRVAIDGPARLIGPELRPLQGGTTGMWLRLTGDPGEIRIRAELAQFPAAQAVVTAEPG
ncbi:MAG: glycoside hydrolase family 2 TIM barrel-domain containing protein [Paracoccus sp. (in: a-proteobacteria)]|uniref:glycoside hydrolase family 2 protein n=1 Tax=Paracoccus sp. TaxID=267 RepID=UPI0026E012B1|nr:glycoside hydrolase family 2 TIM barrel-domain containing protein [Paracoccus sp. (in: a-proteobacteria)]MDO5612316.1 glycoside hydrolase family 2 TIM barrel-domain containing protein [Paracoccus sp. (in: a-proteobacteria)]